MQPAGMPNITTNSGSGGTGVDSYNVSVAAGIILYEIQSQRAVEE